MHRTYKAALPMLRGLTPIQFLQRPRSASLTHWPGHGASPSEGQEESQHLKSTVLWGEAHVVILLAPRWEACMNICLLHCLLQNSESKVIKTVPIVFNMSCLAQHFLIVLAQLLQKFYPALTPSLKLTHMLQQWEICSPCCVKTIKNVKRDRYDLKQYA